MSVKRQAHAGRAHLQWTRLYETLTRQLGARVSLLPPTPGLPDLVFTANAGLMTNGVFIRSNFRYPQRQQEEPVIERYARARGWRMRRLAVRYDFEGEGDALWLGDALIVGFRFRSDAPVHEELARILARRVLPVELADRRFYHLDTCFCPLDHRTVLWFPKAFDRYGRKVFERFADDLIDVAESDALRFVCNAIVVGRSIVMQQGASAALRRRLARRGFRMYAVDLSEFLKAGGSAKCLVLTLSRTRTSTAHT